MAAQPFMSYAAYAAQETTAEVRHEWHDGIVVAMAGGTLRHGALAARIIIALGLALRAGPCQVFGSDVKIRVRPTKLGTYPDVSVVCGPIETDDEDPHSIVNPVLLVEVLSKSTETYDRGAKFAQYRALPSLRAVLFVRTEEPGLELFVKLPDGTWELREQTTGELRIEALDIALDVGELYRAPLPD